MRRIAIFAVCFGLFAAPALAQTKAMMQKLDDQWTAAFNMGDAKAVAAMYTRDAYVLPAGAAMLHDNAAIEKFWKEQMADAQDVKCTALDVKPLGGNVAREVGSCSFMTKKAPLKEVALKYAVVWQKEGGRWKLLQDIWNMDK
jgi:ketosteroid isomerase-like protein